MNREALEYLKNEIEIISETFVDLEIVLSYNERSEQFIIQIKPDSLLEDFSFAEVTADLLINFMSSFPNEDLYVAGLSDQFVSVTTNIKRWSPIVLEECNWSDNVPELLDFDLEFSYDFYINASVETNELYDKLVSMTENEFTSVTINYEAELVRSLPILNFYGASNQDEADETENYATAA